MYQVTGHGSLTTRSINQSLTSTADALAINSSAPPREIPSRTAIRLDVLPPGSIIGGPKEGMTIPVVCTTEGEWIVFGGAMSLGSELGNTTASYDNAMCSIMNSNTNGPILRKAFKQAAWELENPRTAERVHTHQLLASQKIATLIRRLCEAASPDIKPPGPIFSNPVYPEYMDRLKQGVDCQSPYAADDLTQEERDTPHKRSTTLYSILKPAQEASFMSIVSDPEFTGRELRHSVGWRNPGTLNAAGSIISIASATPNAAALQAEREKEKEEARKKAKEESRRRIAGQTAISASQPAQTTRGSGQPSSSQALPRQQVASVSSEQPRDVTYARASPEAETPSQGSYTAWPASLEPPALPSTSGRYQPPVSQDRAPDLAPPQPRSRKRPASTVYTLPEHARHFDTRGYDGLPNPLGTIPNSSGFDGQRPTSAFNSAATSLVATDVSQERSALPSSYAQPAGYPPASAQTLEHLRDTAPETIWTSAPIDHVDLPAGSESSAADPAAQPEFGINVGADDSHPATYTPSSLPHTAQSQSGGYTHPANLIFPPYNAATILPVSSDRPEGPIGTEYSKPVNSGTGIRIIDPNSINADTELMRRVSPRPLLTATAQYPGPEVPWTHRGTHVAPGQQPPFPLPAPSAHVGAGTRAPALLDHLIGPLTSTDASGIPHMTGYAQFGGPRRVRGPRDMDKGKKRT